MSSKNSKGKSKEKKKDNDDNFHARHYTNFCGFAKNGENEPIFYNKRYRHRKDGDDSSSNESSDEKPFENQKFPFYNSESSEEEKSSKKSSPKKNYRKKKNKQPHAHSYPFMDTRFYMQRPYFGGYYQPYYPFQFDYSNYYEPNVSYPDFKSNFSYPNFKSNFSFPDFDSFIPEKFKDLEKNYFKNYYGEDKKRK